MNSTESPQQDARYPVGRYSPPKSITSEQRHAWIDEIEALPANLDHAVSGLLDTQLDTPYREGGWTVRQVVHHFADSHLNSYQRFRLALTEPTPTVKTYAEAAWAELPDAKTAPIELSLSLIRGLHSRWAILMRSLTDDQFALTVKHPEWGEPSLDWMLGLYAWHSKHHLAHISNLRRQKGW